MYLYIYEIWVYQFLLLTENKIDMNSENDAERDFRFTKWMIKHVGLLGIPPSAFFSDNHKTLMQTFVRYCFFKKGESLQKAAEILENWISKQSKY